MAVRSSRNPQVEGAVHIHFSLVGLIVSSVFLVLAVGVLAYVLHPGGSTPRTTNALTDHNRTAPPEPAEIPPWGELIVREIQLERPPEYIAFELSTNRQPTWVFPQNSPEQVRALMLSCGLTAGQADRALSPALVTVSATNTIVRPDDNLILELSPQTRSKLYVELSGSPLNHYMMYPFCFPTSRANDWLDNSGVDAEIVARIKKLLYPRGNATCFSDYELLLRSLPTEKARMDVTKALSRQPALMVRLRIRPDTDVDRLLGYWGRGLQVKDARPLIESMKRLDDGGTVSLLYLLPRFVRERLYTFPMPPKDNEVGMDCHWSTMNFFNDPPDDRFGNPAYIIKYLADNFYQVAEPSLYGDIVLILDKNGNAIHSAVFLADDIVFTKNGNNYSQPWMLMKLQDLESDYCFDQAPRVLVYRRNNQ